jgi:predicted GIY-YIG superfamily endonuclease
LIFPAKSIIDRGMDKTTFFYVYIIQSLIAPNRFYTGFTENIENRIKDHNAGKNSHTAEHKPWRIKTAIAFTDRQKALDFERYLKTKSGRAFAKKRL